MAYVSIMVADITTQVRLLLCDGEDEESKKKIAQLQENSPTT
jgi:hypothetical protein